MSRWPTSGPRTAGARLRRYRLKVGRMRNWKKAIVALHDDYRIDFY